MLLKIGSNSLQIYSPGFLDASSFQDEAGVGQGHIHWVLELDGHRELFANFDLIFGHLLHKNTIW